MPAPPIDADATGAMDLTCRRLGSVAEEVRRGREALRWSQAEVARRSGVSRTVVCEIEAGQRVPSLRTYERLRTALGLDTAAAVLAPPRPRVTLGDEHLTKL